MSHRDNDQLTDQGKGNATVRVGAGLDEEVGEPAAAATLPIATDGLPSGSALIVVRRGPNAGSRFCLDQPVTSAGRDPVSDIYLDDVTASRRHAEFRRSDTEFRVIDLNSLNGTYVNRGRVQSAVLANGDEIQLGKFCLVFLVGPVAL